MCRPSGAHAAPSPWVSDRALDPSGPTAQSSNPPPVRRVKTMLSPFGDQRGWQILYSTDNYLDGYASSPALANKYFPAAGITSPLPNAYFRIGGELRMGEGLRPVLTDVLVKYTS